MSRNIQRLAAGVMTAATVLFALPSATYAAEPQDIVVKTLALPICPVTQNAASERESALLAAFAIKFVEKVAQGAVNLGVNLLNEAARDKTVSTLASSSGYLYASNGLGDVSLHPEIRCVVFFRGTKGAWSPVQPAGNQNLRIFAKHHNLKDIPDIYFEAWLEPSTDNTFFRLRPMAVRYMSPMTHAWAGGTKSAVVTIDFNDPTQEVGKNTFGSVVLPGLSQRMAEISISDPADVTSAWMQLPQLGEDDSATQKILAAEKEPFLGVKTLKAEVAALELGLAAEPAVLKKMRADACAIAAKDKIEDAFCPAGYKKLVAMYADQKQRIAAEKSLAAKNSQLKEYERRAKDAEKSADANASNNVPPGSSLKVFDWRVTLVETERPGEFLKILASAVNEIAPDIKQELKALTPAEKAAKAELELAAQRQRIANENTLELAALTTLNAAQLADAVIADLPANATNAERAKADTEARLAKLKANVAFKLMGRAEPYPGIF
jgi:hypothetical protein